MSDKTTTSKHPEEHAHEAEPREQEIGFQEAWKLNMKRLASGEIDTETYCRLQHFTGLSRLEQEHNETKSRLNQDYAEAVKQHRELYISGVQAHRENMRFTLDRLNAGTDTAQGAVDVATVRSVADMQPAIDSIHAAIAAIPNAVAKAIADAVMKSTP